MKFEMFVQMINSKMAGTDFKKAQQRIENEIQSLLIGLLNSRYGHEGLVITADSALRHIYGLPRFNVNNIVSFKMGKSLNANEFDEIMKGLADDVAQHIELKCAYQISREKKARSIDGKFYIPTRTARLTINKEHFYIINDNHPIYDEQKHQYLDELDLNIVKSEICCESLDVLLSEKVASLLGESTFDGEAMFDVVWMINNGAVIEPDIMEEIVNDHNISNIQLNMMSLANRATSTSLQRELSKVETITPFKLLDAPTDNIAFLRISSIFKDSLVDISPMFGEQHELIRNKKMGFSMDGPQVVDGKNVSGSGIMAAQTLRNVRG
jgi:hypothetical protein